MPETSSTLNSLNFPPIVEVACGFVFAPLDLDALDFGLYWNTRSDMYPKKELHPALQEFIGIRLGSPPMRAWFVSEDEQRILQIQSDRFYMNWRRRDGQYPRFSDNEGNQGLKALALEEFEKFSHFCEEHIQQIPSPMKLELSKIDLLLKGSHYQDAEDLGKLLKVARVFEDIQAGSASRLDLRLSEQHPNGNVNVFVMVSEENTRIETRAVFEAEGDLNSAFVQANQRVNEVFFGLLNQGELERFQTPPEGD
ncbi:MAG: hypothetical protein H6727_07265 [Myxococcales bacterium]|nr:hypothetical protein [Myxococcales bacterium]